jgi:acyl-[acyl-carrier-protein]-phospholipid O-acyltransferase/long-chain-fatty-acid--[acyl-carrier-protein] ligase
MFGTSSFYRLYNRNSKIHPLMMQSLRLCIAGAEKLQDDVRKEFKLKFNKDILEGYGTTEVAPVASVNVPDQISPDSWRVQVSWKPGSVGMPLPGTSFRVVDPHSFESLPAGEAGMVLISGAQVMPGYLKNEQKTKEVLRLIDGKRWYVSGDKGYLDNDGFLYVIDRYSRFAKISGEMVGLGAVETAIKTAIAAQDFDVVVVNLPDERKGERLIALVTTHVDASQLREALLAGGLNTLALPAQYVKVDAVPKLGSGKTDFATARQLAISLVTLA